MTDFDNAVEFVNSSSKYDFKPSDDFKLELYSLYKCATIGECNTPAPMMYKREARLKWNAWKEKGDLSSKDAKNNYVALLDLNCPGWRKK